MVLASALGHTLTFLFLRVLFGFQNHTIRKCRTASKSNSLQISHLEAFSKQVMPAELKFRKRSKLISSHCLKGTVIQIVWLGGVALITQVLNLYRKLPFT